MAFAPGGTWSGTTWRDAGEVGWPLDHREGSGELPGEDAREVLSLDHREGSGELPGKYAGEVGWPLDQRESSGELQYLERKQERFGLWTTGKIVDKYLESMQ